ncbi:MAG: FAD synthetase family protein [Spirochaetaceae bacterium]|jgi:riboflavin kinase/FMN adenylyltransferase|nr:FAD synthetase family protein [Spirochaetaceae bacterium]
MQIISWTDFIKGNHFKSPTSMTIGVFDGIHRGHKALLEKIKSSGFLPVVVTFSESPRKFFKGKNFINEIITLEEKLKIFESEGIAAVILIDFSDDFSKTRGDEFLKTLICKGNLHYLAVGYDFACGFNGKTKTAEVKRIAEECGVKTDVVQPVLEDGLPVSSSRIRSAIASGDYQKASLLLGRSFSAPK